MFGKRRLGTVLGALFQPRHYRALGNMLTKYQNIPDTIGRYLFATGSYPATVNVRTPTGLIGVRLYSRFDMQTLNEIFCRMDYFAEPNLRVVLDIGSNIGISALYFLTRNATSRCYLVEPDPKNIARLRLQLAAYTDRYELLEAAVADRSGEVTFGVEATGRYGGIGVETGESMTVPCEHINQVLGRVLERETTLDLLKIDTEGVEITTVKAADGGLLRQVRQIYMEAYPTEELRPELFTQVQYGPIAGMRNRVWPPAV